MSVMEQVEDSLLRLTGALKHPIVAIDPGPRKCGVASLSPCEVGGLYLNYTRQEPLLSVYDRKASDKMNARTMTDVETAGVVENQPPAGVTGKGGRTTRTLSLAFIYLV